MTSDDTTVAVLVPGDEAEAAEVLVASHDRYPTFVDLFPDATRRARALRPFFEATVRDGMAAGVVDGARDRSGALLGVAVWLPPGAAATTSTRKLRMAPALARVFTAAPRSFLRFARYGANVERSHPGEPHWYLVVLGVHPRAQRRGVGGRLVQRGLARAAGHLVRLETADPGNVAFYARFGFSATDERLELLPGGPSHTAMERPAGW